MAWGGLFSSSIFIMRKEDFMKSLKTETREYVEFLIDEAWCNGFTAGQVEGRIEESYNYFD